MLVLYRWWYKQLETVTVGTVLFHVIDVRLQWGPWVINREPLNDTGHWSRERKGNIKSGKLLLRLKDPNEEDIKEKSL